jgi:hypothetical protein
VTEYTEPDLTPRDVRRLRAFLAPEPDAGPKLLPRTLVLCQVEQQLRADGRMLAAVAPWLLTARLVVHHDG